MSSLLFNIEEAPSLLKNKVKNYIPRVDIVSFTVTSSISKCYTYTLNQEVSKAFVLSTT